jgi:hypothetical protein
MDELPDAVSHGPGPHASHTQTNYTINNPGLTVTLASDGRGDVALEAGALVLSDQVKDKQPSIHSHTSYTRFKKKKMAAAVI